MASSAAGIPAFAGLVPADPRRPPRTLEFLWNSSPVPAVLFGMR